MPFTGFRLNFKTVAPLLHVYILMQPLQEWQINNTRTSACLLPSPTSRFEWFPLANYAFTHLKTTVIVELDASNLSFGAMLYQQSETDSHNCHCARTFYPPSLVIMMEQGIIGQFFFWLLLE